jgi:hypothetical protein
VGTKGHKGKDTYIQLKHPYFDKSLATVGTWSNRTWFSCYPLSQYIIYDNGNEFKLHFETLCVSYGLKHKPTSVKNPQVNAILKQVQETIMAMLCTADISNDNQTPDVPPHHHASMFLLWLTNDRK